MQVWENSFDWMDGMVAKGNFLLDFVPLLMDSEAYDCD